MATRTHGQTLALFSACKFCAADGWRGFAPGGPAPSETREDRTAPGAASVARRSYTAARRRARSAALGLLRKS
jgi:hypothetical protein